MAIAPHAVDSGGMIQMASKGGLAAAGPALGGATAGLISSRSTMGGGFYESNVEMNYMDQMMGRMGGGEQGSSFVSEYREQGAYDQLALPGAFLAHYYSQVGTQRLLSFSLSVIIIFISLSCPQSMSVFLSVLF